MLEQGLRANRPTHNPKAARRPFGFVALTAAGLLVTVALGGGCKVEDGELLTGPTGSDSANDPNSTISSSGGTGSNPSSVSITAPIISDPLSGSTVSEASPKLSILNSARQVSIAPTYLFQVSDQSNFATIAAQSGEVAESTSGSTSWAIDRPLTDGDYFWRVRARIGTDDSQFSSTAQFTVSVNGTTPTPNPSPNPPPAGLIISDPLAGGSVGDVNGGAFTSAGWRITSPGNFIRYEIPSMASGFVEFETAGLSPTNPSPDQFMLFGMWDPSAGDYRANPFRVHLQKLHPNPHNPPYLRLRWISNGEQHDEGSNFLSWDPSRFYQWRIEWGASGSRESARVFLDGNLEVVVNYRSVYRPNVHFVELGIGERGESIVGAVYRNLRIGN